MNNRSFVFIAITVPSFAIFSIASASVYINKIINNTKQRVTIEYAVPVYIKAFSPKFPASCLPTGVMYEGIGVNPRSKDFWNVDLYNGARVLLEDAYIPKALSSVDFKNVITLKTGSISSYSSDAIFATIRLSDGYLERISPDNPRVAIRISEEKLIEGSSYALEIKQISDELYYAGMLGKPILNLGALEIIFKKN